MKVSKLYRRAPSQAPKLRPTDPQVIELWVRAGGRCEFHGCNDFLLQDQLSTNNAKLADIAHIVARSRQGPRGDDPLPIAQRNRIENLFLACTKHHRMIDSKALVEKYPKEVLLQYKQAHEERIRFVTNLGDEHESTVLRLMGKIRGHSVSISSEEIREAMFTSAGRYPRYLGGENHIEMNLTALSEKLRDRYWEAGIERINDIVERILAPAIEKGEIRHLSVFAMAQIPFLIHLGYILGDKIPIEIYQKHRAGTEGWFWRTNESAHRFIYKKERNGQDSSLVALTLSVSGEISTAHLPAIISDSFSIYSLSPDAVKPDRTILNSKDTLEEFRLTYAKLLREIEASHPNAKAVHIFPAVPISAALVLGREILKNVTPSLIVYDIGIDGFQKAIEIASRIEST